MLTYPPKAPSCTDTMRPQDGSVCHRTWARSGDSPGRDFQARLTQDLLAGLHPTSCRFQGSCDKPEVTTKREKGVAGLWPREITPGEIPGEVQGMSLRTYFQLCLENAVHFMLGEEDLGVVPGGLKTPAPTVWPRVIPRDRQGRLGTGPADGPQDDTETDGRPNTTETGLVSNSLRSDHKHPSPLVPSSSGF